MKKLHSMGLTFGLTALFGVALLFGGRVTAGVCWSGFTGTAVAGSCPASSCDPSFCTSNCGAGASMSSCSPNGGMCLMVCTY